MTRTFESAVDLLSAVGSDLGYSNWHGVPQTLIDDFADVTDDHQWIHVDRDRAAAGPFGTTVAHGYLTLAMIPALVRETFRVTGARMAVNYGLERVRFPAPLPAGSRIRAHVRIRDAAVDDGRVRLITEVTVASGSSRKPCCVADTVTLFIFEEA